MQKLQNRGISATGNKQEKNFPARLKNIYYTDFWLNKEKTKTNDMVIYGFEDEEECRFAEGADIISKTEERRSNYNYLLKRRSEDVQIPLVLV